MYSDVVERFLRYVQIDTQSSDESSDKTPSTNSQFTLAQLLAKELQDMGIEEVELSEHAYVIAQLPASKGCEDKDALALIAHIDTAPDEKGAGVCPQIISYQGGDIQLNEHCVIAEKDFPELVKLQGCELIVTDGTTLLGADDKAGVAEIMSLAAYLIAHPEIAHPRLALCFTPDEEIGHGAELLDLERVAASFAYTVDGGEIGELECQNFNAASMKLSVKGAMIHPGYAKNRMINALQLVHDFHGMLPAHMRPEHTEGFEGFFHLCQISGTVSHAEAKYIIRDHDPKKFAHKKSLALEAAEFLRKQEAQADIQLEIWDEYFNMYEKVKEAPQLISYAQEAFEEAGFTCKLLPIRGGTDGARLSWRGLICPNLSTGGYNFHSTKEFIPIYALEGMVKVLSSLVQRFT